MAILGVSPLRRMGVVAGAGGMVAAGMLAAAGPASAQPVTCGTTLMASVTLTQNVDCTGDTTDPGLTIGTSGVTVDLNGYSILGPGDSAGTEGILDHGYSGLTVENGTISDFVADVDVEGSSGSDLTGVVVRHLTTTDNTPQQSTAILGVYLDGASIENLASRDAGTGVSLGYNQGSAVSNSHFTSPSAGIYDYFGDGEFISRDTMSDVTEGGIEVYESPGDVVQSNTITGGRLGTGIEFESTGTLISRNVVNGLDAGIYDFNEFSGDSVGNTVSDNKGSGDAWGLYTNYPYEETYTGNTFDHGEYGIETDFPYAETLRGNTTDDNSEAGVYVYTDGSAGYAATLTRNTANGNRFGLYSQIPTSGTGNHAAHNKVVNCYHVSCPKAAPRSGGIAAPPHHPPVAAPVTPVTPPGKK